MSARLAEATLHLLTWIAPALFVPCRRQFMKAGARGISVLFASGDQGVCGRSGCGFLEKRFKPDFPGGSPYITAVGGTNFATKSVIGAETAWSGSGGGFSDTFAIPSYQVVHLPPRAGPLPAGCPSVLLCA